MDIIQFKWGTAPPLKDAQGNILRAFGIAAVQVIDPVVWGDSATDPESALPQLRACLNQALQECLPQASADLPVFSQILQSQARRAFQKLGLDLIEVEIQSLQNAENAPEPAFHDPLPSLPLLTFGLNFPVDDIRLSPPEEPDEP